MEEHRRTESGRVRTAREFVANFFPYDESGATDKLFSLMPNEVRGPILSKWGIRGGKAALKDDDEKVKAVVHDALVAGDIDEAIFEEGVSAEILVAWVSLGDWWTFWRRGKLTGLAIQKALATARELELIDDRWFFANVQGRGGKLKGTDVVCDTLSKDQIVAWVRKVHESGDGSPTGLVAALGWETILAKTAQDALLFALDAFAKKAGLAPDAPDAKKEEAILQSARAPQEAQPETPRRQGEEREEREKRDSGLPVAIPDIPAIDAAEEGAEPPPSADSNTWTSHETSKLTEAREKMIEMLNGQPAARPQGWTSDAAEKSASAEWPEPSPIALDPTKGTPAPNK